MSYTEISLIEVGAFTGLTSLTTLYGLVLSESHEIPLTLVRYRYLDTLATTKAPFNMMSGIALQAL